ncbi:hypothetical protein QOT17_006348 [Balamuthia mandrillaris]
MQATKMEIQEVKMEIQEVKREIQEVKREIQEVKREIQEVKTEIRAESDEHLRSAATALLPSLVERQVNLLALLNTLTKRLQEHYGPDRGTAASTSSQLHAHTQTVSPDMPGTSSRESSSSREGRPSAGLADLRKAFRMAKEPNTSPSAHSLQHKVPDTLLTSRRIEKPLILSSGNSLCKVPLGKKNAAKFCWVRNVFASYRHFRLPTALESTLQPKLARCPNAQNHGFQVLFIDGPYETSDLTIPKEFTFSTTDANFQSCASHLCRLSEDMETILSGLRSEGTIEMELYIWLYSCFIFGCSKRLDRAWKGTVKDKGYPLKDPQRLSKAELLSMLMAGEKLQKAAFTKTWHPDGIVGLAGPACSNLVNNDQLIISECVYVGFLAIEHKKDSDDLSDINTLTNEMYLLCCHQRKIGIQHPLAFGIYWAKDKFFLFCMETRQDKDKEMEYIPHQLLQLSSAKDSDLVLIFRALWYLRLHGLHLAHLVETDVEDFFKNANIYSCKQATRPVKRRRPGGAPSGSSSSPESKKDEGPQSDGSSDKDPPSKQQGTKDEGNHCRDMKGKAREKKGGAKECIEGKAGDVVCDRVTGQRFLVLSKVLSVGHRNCVQLGKDLECGKLVVLKWRLDGDTDAFNRELNALRRLSDCPGIVQLIGEVYDERQDLHGLVLEHLGNSVPLSPPAITGALFRHYMHQLLKALSCCEEKGIVHHDVKAANVVFTEDKRAVIIDFDFSVFVPWHPYTNYPCSSGHTPLELADGSYIHSSSAIDVWCAGIVLLMKLLNIEFWSNDIAWDLVAILQSAPVGLRRKHVVEWLAYHWYLPFSHLLLLTPLPQLKFGRPSDL